MHGADAKKTMDLHPPREATGRPRSLEQAARDGGVSFQCEVCRREIHDLRAVFLAHRLGIGWRIECSGHGDAEHAMDAGHLFGGGLRALELFADLARERWFEPAGLFQAFQRLRAQAARRERA